MEMEEHPASARDPVAMEMPVGDAPSVAGDKERSAKLELDKPQELTQHRVVARCVAPPFYPRKYYMLIVIGETATEDQLQNTKEHIKRGESDGLSLSSPSEFFMRTGKFFLV